MLGLNRTRVRHGGLSAPAVAVALVSALVLGALVLGSGVAEAQTAVSSGNPLPRFEALRRNEVNLRKGPGPQYPIDWVYRRKNLPVEVIAEYELWRKIRDYQGTEGWIHSTLLYQRRTFIVTGDIQALRRSDQDDSRPVARLEPGVVGTILRCPTGTEYCQVEVGNHKGWLKRDQFWGVHPRENFER